MLWSSAPGLLSSLRWDYLWVSDSLPTCGRSSGCALKRTKMEATPVINIVPSTCLPWHDRFTCRRGYVWRIRWHGSCHGSLYCSHLLSLVIPKYTTDTVFLWRLRLFFLWNVGLLWVQIVLGTSEAHQSFSPTVSRRQKHKKHLLNSTKWNTVAAPRAFLSLMPCLREFYSIIPIDSR